MSKKTKKIKIPLPLNQPQAKRSTAAKVYALLIILLVGFLCYSNTLHGPFIFDDIPNIAEREGLHLKELSGQSLTVVRNASGNRPVVMLSFALNYYYGKLNPYGYHLVNLIVHLMCAVLVYFFINLTLTLPSLRERYGEKAQEIALLCGLLFVAHPVQTQAVSYIVQRMASMATLFFMLSIYAYAKARLCEGAKRTVYFVVCALAGLLSLGCKEISVTLPFFIALYEFYFLQEKISGEQKKWLYITICLIVFLGVLGAEYYTAFDFWGWFYRVYKKYPFTPGQRMLTQVRIVVFYVGLLIWPLPSRLNLDYDFPLSYSLLNPPTTLICLFLVAGLIIVSIYLTKKQPLISFALIWFWGNLALESSILPLELVYEHRLYLPVVGAFLLASISLSLLKKEIKTVVLVVLIVSLGVMTYQRNMVWQDEVAIWKDAVSKSPGKARPYYNLANVYAQHQDCDSAIPYYLGAIKAEPDYAKAHTNLGFCYFYKGKIQEAIAETKTALRYDPNHVDAHFNLGTYYCNQGKIAEGREQFKAALALNSNYKRAAQALKELGLEN